MNINNKYLIGVIVVLAGACIYLFSTSLRTHDQDLNPSTNAADHTGANFSQKQVCASYRTEIESKVADYDWSDDSANADAELNEIWFSVSQNSCLYSITQRITYMYAFEVVNSYAIYDHLQSVTLLDINDSSNPDAAALFEQKKAELR